MIWHGVYISDELVEDLLHFHGIDITKDDAEGEEKDEKKIEMKMT